MGISEHVPENSRQIRRSLRQLLDHPVQRKAADSPQRPGLRGQTQGILKQCVRLVRQTSDEPILLPDREDSDRPIHAASHHICKQIILMCLRYNFLINLDSSRGFGVSGAGRAGGGIVKTLVAAM